MKTRWIVNLVLAAIVLGLAALVYLRPAAEAPIGPPLTTLRADAITHIEIARNGVAVVLENASGAWRLRQPISARANTFNVDSLLRLTSANSSFQAPADAAALATYGLEKPALRVRLNGEEIAIGAIHPMRQQHYVRYRDTVHLISSYVLATAFQHYTAFIDTQLLEQGRKLRALRLPSMRLVHTDGSWRAEPPPGAEVSADRLNELVAEWENARALSVERLSPRAALAQIELTFDHDGKLEMLTLGILAYKPEFILTRRDEGLEYHFPEEVGKRLLTLQGNLN